MSRYAEEDPVKHDSPTRIFEEIVPESPRQTLILCSPPKLDYARKPSGSPEPEKKLVNEASKPASPIKDAAPAKKAAPEVVSQPIRAGAKRKFGDENGTAQTATGHAGKENVVAAEKILPARAGLKRRSLAEPTGVKQERRGTRTPLAAKSTNADVSSPRKASKGAPLKEPKKEKANGPEDTVMRDVVPAPKPLPVVEIPAPEATPVVAVLLEAATSLPSAAPSSPSTPNRQPQEAPHDTPPPADISSTGEMSRPSRRVRASISYAEPNLRDKMRRPTKQLFDAVAGEGKFVHRGTKQDEHSGPTSSSKVRSEPEGSTGRSDKILAAGDPTSKAQLQALLSPLAQKDVLPETLPNTVVTERRKRPSAVRESLTALSRPRSASPELTRSTAMEPQATAGSSSSNNHTATATTNPPPSASDADIYDFAASSPTSHHSSPDTSSGEFKPTPSTTTAATTNSRSRTARKSSMAAAAALREILDEEEHDDMPTKTHQPPRPPNKPRSATHAGRKRSSMLAPNKSSMLLDSLEDAAADADTSGTSAEGERGGRERETGGRGVARRRSMML